MPKSGNFSPAFLGSLTPAATMAVALSAEKSLEERQEERWHVDESLMQRAVKNAILEAGINDLYPCSEPRG